MSQMDVWLTHPCLSPQYSNSMEFLLHLRAKHGNHRTPTKTPNRPQRVASAAEVDTNSLSVSLRRHRRVPRSNLELKIVQPTTVPASRATEKGGWGRTVTLHESLPDQNALEKTASPRYMSAEHLKLKTVPPTAVPASRVTEKRMSVGESTAERLQEKPESTLEKNARRRRERRQRRHHKNNSETHKTPSRRRRHHANRYHSRTHTPSPSQVRKVDLQRRLDRKARRAGEQRSSRAVMTT